MTRRSFLRNSLRAAAAVALIESGSAAAVTAEAKGKSQGVRLGGPSFARDEDPEALALAHRKLGYRAAYCPGVSLKDKARIQAISGAFARHDVVIAEVGRWCNLMDTDLEKRRKNMETVIDGLALAEEIGARCCVNIAGSFNSASWFGPHPENLSKRHFDASVENARKIIDAVKPARAKFCYEMMGWMFPDGPDNYIKMIKAVDRSAFAVHLDPCNLINSPTRFYKNTDLLNECFDKLGRWIMSCHAKDLTWDVEMNLHFREVVPGKGCLDFATYLRCLARLPQNPPLMIEHMSSAEDYTAAREHIFKVGHETGVSFN